MAGNQRGVASNDPRFSAEEDKMLKKLKRRALYLVVTFIIENVIFPDKGWGLSLKPNVYAPTVAGMEID